MEFNNRNAYLYIMSSQLHCMLNVFVRNVDYKITLWHVSHCRFAITMTKLYILLVRECRFQVRPDLVEAALNTIFISRKCMYTKAYFGKSCEQSVTL